MVECWGAAKDRPWEEERLCGELPCRWEVEEGGVPVKCLVVMANFPTGAAEIKTKIAEQMMLRSIVPTICKEHFLAVRKTEQTISSLNDGFPSHSSFCHELIVVLSTTTRELRAATG